MKHPSEKNAIITLQDWLGTPLGHYVKSWEQKRLDVLSADIFGFKALQVGLPEVDGLRANRMSEKWFSDVRGLSGFDTHNSLFTLSHDIKEFPFESNSLDLVILPHTLEFSQEPYQTLCEAARVLIPEGQLIVSGFNPVSLWGLRQATAGWVGKRFLPQEAELISLSRIKDWLKLLNLEANRGYCGCYLPPLSSSKARERYAFMDKAGDRWWPSFGGVYLLQAVKRVHGMTLVGPAINRTKKKGRKVPVVTKQRHEYHEEN